MQTEITCKKIYCFICTTRLAGGLLLKMLKLNFLKFSHVQEIVES